MHRFNPLALNKLIIKTFLFVFTADSILIQGTWREPLNENTKTTNTCVFTALRDVAPMLDSSSLPETHDFFCKNITPNRAASLLALRKENKKKLGTLGYEASKEILHFVGCRPKLYGLKFIDQTEKIKCKGINLRLVDLKFNMLYDLAVGRDKVSHLVLQKSILSKNHHLFLKTYRKKAADALDLKRYFEMGNMKSHAFGSIDAITYQECYEWLDAVLKSIDSVPH